MPNILKDAQKYKSLLLASSPNDTGVILLLKNQLLQNLHIFMLPVNGPTPDFSSQEVQQAQIKLENYISYNTTLDLTKEEELALLYHPEILQQAAIQMKLL